MFERIGTFIGDNPALCIVVLLILIVASLGLGYMVGINQFNKKIDSDIDKVIKRLKYEGAVSASIIDNVGLGVIAYDRNGVFYSNHTLDSLAEFLPDSTDGKSLKYIPKTVDEFLNRYDRNNHLKSNYLLHRQTKHS